MLRLSDDDGRAVDLLLDAHTTAADSNSGDGGDGSAAPHMPAATSAFQLRLANVERILSLLGALPVADPPQSLLARTLRKLEVPEQPALPPMLGGDEESSLRGFRPYA